MTGWIGAWLMKSWTQNMKLLDGMETVALWSRNWSVPIAESYVLFDGRVTGGHRMSLLRKCLNWNLAVQGLCLSHNSLKCRYMRRHHPIERISSKVIILRSYTERFHPRQGPPILLQLQGGLDGNSITNLQPMDTKLVVGDG